MAKRLTPEQVEKMEEIILEHPGIPMVDLVQMVGYAPGAMQWVLTAITSLLPVYDEYHKVGGRRVMCVYLNEDMLESFRVHRNEIYSFIGGEYGELADCMGVF